MTDSLALLLPRTHSLLRERWLVDEFYEGTVLALSRAMAVVCDLLDRWVWGGLVRLVSQAAEGFSTLSRWADDWLVNGSFDQVCRKLTRGGGLLSALQDGQVRNYLRVIAVSLAALVLWMLMGGIR
jgi:hypothetical protein